MRRLKTQERGGPDLQDVVEYVEEAATVASNPVYGTRSQEVAFKQEHAPSDAPATQTHGSIVKTVMDGHAGCQQLKGIRSKISNSFLGAGVLQAPCGTKAPCVVPQGEDSLLGVFYCRRISQDLLGISSFSLGMVQDTGLCERR